MATRLPLHLEPIAQRIDALGVLLVTSCNGPVTNVLCRLGIAETCTDARGRLCVRLTDVGHSDLATLANNRRSKGLRDYHRSQHTDA